MKFRIYEDKKKEAKVFFRLVYDIPRGDIDLVACNEDGETIDDGLILSIKPSGHVALYSDVSDRIGLSLDSESRVDFFYPDRD